MPDARQTQHPGAGESESSGDDSSYTSESSQEEDPQHEEDNDKGEETEFVNVDLEFFDPSEIDYHGLKMLLRSLLDGDEFQGCSDLVEAIIRQVRLGFSLGALDLNMQHAESESHHAFAEHRWHCCQDCRD